MDLAQTLGILLEFDDAPAAIAARAAAERRAPGHSASQAFEPRSRARAMHRGKARGTREGHAPEHTRFRWHQPGPGVVVYPGRLRWFPHRRSRDQELFCTRTSLLTSWPLVQERRCGVVAKCASKCASENIEQKGKKGMERIRGIGRMQRAISGKESRGGARPARAGRPPTPRP